MYCLKCFPFINGNFNVGGAWEWGCLSTLAGRRYPNTAVADVQKCGAAEQEKRGGSVMGACKESFKPQKLNPGPTVGAKHPSWFCGVMFRHVCEQKCKGWKSGTARHRRLTSSSSFSLGGEVSALI